MPQDRSTRAQQERFVRQMRREAAREEAKREQEELKAAKVQYLQSRLDEASELTEQADSARTALEGLLSQALGHPVAPLDLGVLKQRAASLPLDLGADAVPIPRPHWVEPTPPGTMGRLLGGTGRYESTRQRARARFDQEVADRDVAEVARQHRVIASRQKHDESQAAANRRIAEGNAAVDRLIAGVESGDRYAVTDYYRRVVATVRDPDLFPSARRVAYVPESTLLVMEWDLPKLSVVPEEASYRYVKSRDEIDVRPASIAERRVTYRRLIAQMALRALRLVFGADPNDSVGTVVFNGMIDDVDRSNGQDVRRCLITMRATSDQFGPVKLERVDPVECVCKYFAADVSEHPDELKAVPAVLEFDMADPRVIDPVDVLSEIDRRPNLLDLTHGEFEHFVQNLFARMGFQVQVFKPGGDGGIDCVVYDPRKVFGGKFCVQVKQYVGTVQPSAVRDLYGAIQHEGATKGLLITTGGFGPSSYAWANGKPLQLITGTELLHLCHEYDIPARILRPPKGTRTRPSKST